jgi:uncharacterized protein YdiU (UPF0061 family)
MMNNLFNFQDYKKAKIIIQDLTDLLNIIIRFKKELSPYSKYTFVKDIYRVLMDNQATIEGWLNKYKHIVNQKGSTNDKVEAAKETNPKPSSNKT